MKAKITNNTITVHLDLSKEELDHIMKGIGQNCSCHKLMQIGMTREQADTLIRMWTEINDQCGSEYSSK